MNNFLNSYFVKSHKLEISITIIAVALFLIYFLGAPHVFTRFPIYRAFMQSMPFFGIIAISATFVVTLGEIDLSFPSIVGITSLTFGLVLTATGGNFFILNQSFQRKVLDFPLIQKNPIVIHIWSQHHCSNYLSNNYNQSDRNLSLVHLYKEFQHSFH